MALADGTVFAAVVPEVQHWMLGTMDLGQRLAFAARGVVFDEIVLRFGVLAALVWALARVRGRTDDATWWVAILIVALAVYPLSAWSYFSALDWSGLTVAREVLLHGGAGALWGWLCWRHGWLAGLAGHLAAHLSLQPLLG
jgi:hypothetical protein